MKRKTIRKTIIALSVLISFILFFETTASAFDINDAFNSFSKDEPDFSRTPIEINIISPQAILQGREMQMNFETPGTTSYVSVKWSSSNPDVISCTEDGKIKGLIKGSATITVKVTNGKGSDSITVYCAKKFEEPETVNLKFPFFWVNKTPVFYDAEKFRICFKLLNGMLPYIYYKEVKVLGYYDGYFYVEYEDGGELCHGLMLSIFLPNNVGSKEIFRQISYDRIVLRQGESSGRPLTTDYKGNVDWIVSDKNIVSFNKDTGKITAKSPGMAMITAKVGITKISCLVYSVSQWMDPETAVAAKDVIVREIPSVTGDKAGTILKGTSMTADGDLENGMKWIYVTSGNTKGFVHLSDFPGINYLMTEYHYFDQGFEKRYGSGFGKIRDYSSVLNDVMMRIFGLKISQHIEEYTSLADECKIKTYGSVYWNNLYAECPKTQGHSSDACIVDLNLLNSMLKEKGNCTNTVTRCLWTGHCLYDNPPSFFYNTKGSILFTIAGYTRYSKNTGKFENLSDLEIRERALYEIVHETAHTLGAVDGYCAEDYINGHCSNEYCYDCNGLPIPDCIMVNNRSNPEYRASVFCEDCIETINNHLSNHH